MGKKRLIIIASLILSIFSLACNLTQYVLLAWPVSRVRWIP